MSETKVSKAVLYSEVASAISREASSPLPEFPRRYFVDETSPGIRLYLRETDEPEVVEYVHELCLANEILGWIKKQQIGGYPFDTKAAVETARVWRATTEPIKKIKSVDWAFDSGFTFRRLPWKRGMIEPTPLFTEMFSRISNSRALKAFIGSLFFEESDMQQYIWIHSQGETGKGSLSRFLHRVFENAYSSQIPPMAGDKFWTSMIMGKRLVVFPDCNNTSFVTSGLFKSLTGGDPIRVEQKNQPAGTAIMQAKYIILSNERPALSSERADQRRIIYCEMGGVKNETDPKYGDKLWAEGGSFLYECIRIYQNDCFGHGSIPTKNEETLHDWISTIEEEFEEIFLRGFKVNPNSYILPAAFQNRMETLFKQDRRRQMEFRSWLERRHQVKKTSRREGDSVLKIYSGLELVFTSELVKTADIEQKKLQETLELKSRREKTASRLASSHLKPVEPHTVDAVDD